MVSWTSSSHRFNLALILASLLLPVVLAAGCGKKAAPFLSGPREKVDLELGETRVRRDNISLTVRIPRENFSLGQEEEPWSLVRILRRKSEGSESLVERQVFSEGGGFPFGTWRSFEDRDIGGGGPFLYIVEARKRESRDLAVSAPVRVRLVPPPVASGLEARGREGAITLSWSTPKETIPGTSFDLFRRSPGESDYTVINREPLTATSYTDIEVSAGGEYCYRVRATARDGAVLTEGSQSTESCATVEEMTQPLRR